VRERIDGPFRRRAGELAALAGNDAVSCEWGGNFDWSVTQDEWAASARSDRRCSVFQTPEWGRVVLRAGLARSVRVVGARFAGGGSLLLPMAEVWRGRTSGLSAYESMPVSVYGGPIISGRVNQDEAERAVTGMCLDARLNARSVLITGSPRAAIRLREPFVERTIRAHVLEIEGGEEQVTARYSKNFNRDLKIAANAGVTVRHGNSVEDLLAYHALYEHSLGRWGADATSRHSKELFLALDELPVDGLRVWLGEIAGKPVAGIVMLYHGATAIYWHGAFDGAHARQMPSKAVLDAALRDAGRRGYRCVDMLSSGGHAGVERFKESMGARPQIFHEYDWHAGGWRRISGALQGGVALVLHAGRTTRADRAS
jgi:hypothetical protein